MSEWQPIETAPKDGKYILGYGPNDPILHLQPLMFWQAGRSPTHFEKHPTLPRTFVEVDDLPNPGYWSTVNNGWNINPTHWMPLPPPPVDIAREK